MQQLGSIYRITNIRSGKVYIGQTRQHPDRRKMQHQKHLQERVHTNRAMQRDYDHGDKFAWNVIETNVPLPELDAAEDRWIAAYLGNGYNVIWSDGYRIRGKGKEVRPRPSSKNDLMIQLPYWMWEFLVIVLIATVLIILLM